MLYWFPNELFSLLLNMHGYELSGTTLLCPWMEAWIGIQLGQSGIQILFTHTNRIAVN